MADDVVTSVVVVVARKSSRLPQVTLGEAPARGRGDIDGD